jgi:ABC-type methionine transport system ATPase subunit
MEDAILKSREIKSTNEQKLTDARQAIAEIFQATDLEYLRVKLWHFLKP